VIAALSPALLPRPADAADRFAMLEPQALFLNAEAARRLQGAESEGRIALQAAGGRSRLRVAGSVAAPGRRWRRWTSPAPGRARPDRPAVAHRPAPGDRRGARAA
jgi:hypothetical protein